MKPVIMLHIAGALIIAGMLVLVIPDIPREIALVGLLPYGVGHIIEGMALERLEAKRPKQAPTS